MEKMDKRFKWCPISSFPWWRTVIGSMIWRRGTPKCRLSCRWVEWRGEDCHRLACSSSCVHLRRSILRKGTARGPSRPGRIALTRLKSKPCSISPFNCAAALVHSEECKMLYSIGRSNDQWIDFDWIRHSIEFSTEWLAVDCKRENASLFSSIMKWIMGSLLSTRKQSSLGLTKRISEIPIN